MGCGEMGMWKILMRTMSRRNEITAIREVHLQPSRAGSSCEIENISAALVNFARQPMVEPISLRSSALPGVFICHTWAISRVGYSPGTPRNAPVP